MKDKISIIVPVYNVEKYIEKCIESIREQTYENLEIIIINDGSTDSSEYICNKYFQKDKRIIFVNQENHGVSATRNRGLDISTGNYIGFVDSDDYIACDMFELLYKNMRGYDADISMCNAQSVYANGKTASDENGRNLFENYNLDSDDVLVLENDKKIVYSLKSDNNYLWNKLYKKSLFNEIIFPYNKIFEDIFVMYKLIEKCRKIIISPEYKYYYVQRENSIISQHFTARQFDLFESYTERYDYLLNKYPYLEATHRKYIFTSLMQCIHKAYISGKIEAYIETIKNMIDKAGKYDFEKCGLSEEHENILKIIFSDIQKYINILKFITKIERI